MAHDETLVGRTHDMARIGELLVGDDTALLLSGEPGVGKSMVLDAMARSAAERGVRILRADGVEFEADMAFAGLNQLLLPVMNAADGLEGPYRDALNVAVGLGDGVAPGRMAVSNAVLTLLRTVAVERPLLLVIDDLPWIDRASVGVLGFVARRLSGTRVSIISASRTGAEGVFPCGTMPEYELPPLDDDSARLLVGARFPGTGGAGASARAGGGSRQRAGAARTSGGADRAAAGRAGQSARRAAAHRPSAGAVRVTDHGPVRFVLTPRAAGGARRHRRPTRRAASRRRPR